MKQKSQPRFDVFISASEGKEILLDDPLSVNLSEEDAKALCKKLNGVGFKADAAASDGSNTQIEETRDSEEAYSGRMPVSKKALNEIRATLCNALETAINMCLECSQVYDSGQAAELIRPAVENSGRSSGKLDSARSGSMIFVIPLEVSKSSKVKTCCTFAGRWATDP